MPGRIDHGAPGLVLGDPRLRAHLIQVLLQTHKWIDIRSTKFISVRCYFGPVYLEPISIAEKLVLYFFDKNFFHRSESKFIFIQKNFRKKLTPRELISSSHFLRAAVSAWLLQVNSLSTSFTSPSSTYKVKTLPTIFFSLSSFPELLMF